jgi:hypothetical protein
VVVGAKSGFAGEGTGDHCELLPAHVKILSVTYHSSCSLAPVVTSLQVPGAGGNSKFSGLCSPFTRGRSWRGAWRGASHPCSGQCNPRVSLTHSGDIQGEGGGRGRGKGEGGRGEV